MFKDERIGSRFKWDILGDYELGRPNLGSTTHIAIYRLMQYTLRDVLISRYGVEATNSLLFSAGKIAGNEFCKNLLDVSLGFDEFLSNIQSKMVEYNIGIMRVEKSDYEKMEFTLTMSEDLDCSGLPVWQETVCDYDEGFFSGVFSTYTGREFLAKEIDCWATGDRTCRFSVKPINEI